MREIKFKAWDKVFKKIVTVEEINFLIGTANVCTTGETRYLTSLDILVIMQYTGLKDKNDVEIYNGDIILYNNNKKYKIAYDKYCAGYKAYLISEPDEYDVRETTLCATSNLDKNIYIEVIGNIYEDKELL